MNPFCQHGLAANPPILVPAYSISDSRLKDFAVSVGYVFSLPNEDVYLTAEGRLANFIFLSQANAIVDGKIQGSVLSIFDEPAKQRLSALHLDSDVCSVLPIGLANDQTAVLAVHASNKGAIDVGRKCFLVGLAIFNGGTPEEIEEIQRLDLKSAVMFVLSKFSKFGER